MFISLFFSFLILFTLFIRNQLDRGIYLILLFLPSYQIRLNLFGLPTTLLEWMIIILAILWIYPYLKNGNFSWKQLLLSLKTNKNNPIPRHFAYPIILFLLASWISVFVSNNTNAAFGTWKAYFFEAIIFFIITTYLLTQKKYQQAITFLGVLAIANGLIACYQYFSGNLISNPFWAQEIGRRSTGLFPYPNANSLLIAPLVPLFIGQIILHLKNKKLFPVLIFGIATIFSITTIYWVKSSGAIIALIVSGLIFLLYYKKTRLSTLILALCFFASIPFTPIKQKIEKIFISTYEIRLPMNPTSWQIRAQQWRETRELIKQSPLLGSGLNNYQNAVKPFHINKHIEIFLYPHNLFLNFWTEIGLLGLLAFIWLILAFFRMCVKTYPANKILTLSLGLAMITLLVHGLVDVPYFKNDLAILFWFIVAGPLIVNKDRDEK